MFDEFAAGGVFPRPEDKARLARYEQARTLYEGTHWESEDAKRITEKLKETNVMSRSGMSAEGIVYLVINLPRLVCDKFADLQVLQPPVLTMDTEEAEEAFRERLHDDIPDMWALWHEALSLKRGLGDAIVSVFKRADDDVVQMRVVDPARWFPVLDENDPVRVLAHQLAWIEAHEVGPGQERKYLRVDTARPDALERRAFLLEGSKATVEGWKIEGEVSLATHWGDLAELDTSALGGLMSVVHLSNGRLEASLPFGRPEFIDSGPLIDDINWRLAAWSDANDKVSHAPRIIPSGYLEQDQYGTVQVPSQYTRVYAGKSKADPSEYPRYMEYSLDHATLFEQWQQSLLAFLIRHELSPAMLGYQFGNEKESGEAKSLGMGTTEAATRRDLLRTAPRANEALTALARLAGVAGGAVRTHWRVGLPKTQDQLFAELASKRALGVVTRRDVLEELYPWYTPEQIDAKLEELESERAAEAAAFDSPFEAREG